MKFNFLERKSIRLPNYDYAEPGYYFITVCTKDRECFFGKIVNEEIILSEIGKIVKKEWWETFFIRSYVDLYEFVIMPNHFHAIIEIIWNDNNIVNTVNKFGPQKNNLFSIVRGFKGSVTSKVRNSLNYHFSVWQSRFYDHIIRNEEALNNIRQYIIDNPKNWNDDLNNLDYLPELNLKKRESLLIKHYNNFF